MPPTLALELLYLHSSYSCFLPCLGALVLALKLFLPPALPCLGHAGHILVQVCSYNK